MNAVEFVNQLNSGLVIQYKRKRRGELSVIKRKEKNKRLAQKEEEGEKGFK